MAFAVEGGSSANPISSLLLLVTVAFGCTGSAFDDGGSDVQQELMHQSGKPDSGCNSADHRSADLEGHRRGARQTGTGLIQRYFPRCWLFRWGRPVPLHILNELIGEPE